MPSLDIFNNDAFSMVQLTQAINKTPYKPGLITSMNLFSHRSVRTQTVAIEKRAGALRLIQTSERGAPPTQQDVLRRDIRDFRTKRLFKQDTLYAHEIQGARAFGSETEVETMQGEVAQRQGRLLDDFALTLEYHLLATTAGIWLDADGSVLYNWFTEWGISQPSELTFSNANVTAAGGMRAYLKANIIRPILRAAQVGNATGISIVALCGDAFYDWLVAHADVEKTYLNWNAASELRGDDSFGEFEFGGIKWLNYRGTDDNSTVAVGSNKVRFFVRGIPGLFEIAHSPAESFEFVNTPGQQLYSRIVPDTARNEWVQIEVMSYPLAICTRPETLLRGTL